MSIVFFYFFYICFSKIWLFLEKTTKNHRNEVPKCKFMTSFLHNLLKNNSYFRINTQICRLFWINAVITSHFRIFCKILPKKTKKYAKNIQIFTGIFNQQSFLDCLNTKLNETRKIISPNMKLLPRLKTVWTTTRLMNEVPALRHKHPSQRFNTFPQPFRLHSSGHFCFQKSSLLYIYNTIHWFYSEIRSVFFYI